MYLIKSCAILITYTFLLILNNIMCILNLHIYITYRHTFTHTHTHKQ